MFFLSQCLTNSAFRKGLKLSDCNAHSLARSASIIKIPSRPRRSDPKFRGSDLRDGVVSEVHPGEHGEERERPCEGGHHAARRRPPEHEEREVGGEEEGVLRVAGRPSVGVAGLEKLARGRAGLRDGVLDELVEDLRDEEPRGEADALQLAAEHEVGDEAAEADEDGDEGDPREEEADLVAPVVADVGERDGLERRRHRRGHLLVLTRPGHGSAAELAFSSLLRLGYRVGDLRVALFGRGA